MFLKKQSYSLKGKFTHPKGRFFSSREKIADNFTSLREKTCERHIPPVRPILLGGGPSSLSYRMMSHRDKFTYPKDMVGINKPVFSKERVVEMERPMRCIIPPKVSPGKKWHIVQHKKFP